MNRKLTIFVHRASECLTDHEMHGEGLICFSLLNGLAERGHTIYAFTDRAAIRNKHPRLHVRAEQATVPIHSFSPWQQSWRADRWMRELMRTVPIDVVWWMNPTGAIPHVPPSRGRPLVIGPIYYSWPKESTASLKVGRPRFGVSLAPLITPLLKSGWRRTLQKAALIFCATLPHATALQRETPGADVRDLPLIVEPPTDLPVSRQHFDGTRPLRLVFVGQLCAHKNPQIFCDLIGHLHATGVPVEGYMVGDGPERFALEEQSRAANSNVTFVGKVPNSQVWEHVQRADFLISTSTGEPYGRGIAEAMAVGTPPICHRSGGPADFIEHAVDGVLIEEMDATHYTKAILQFSEPEQWEWMSKNCLKKACSWRNGVVIPTLERLLLAAPSMEPVEKNRY